MRVTSSHIPLAEIDRSLVEIDCFGSLHEYDSPAVSDPNAWPYAGAVRPSMAPSAELYGPEGTPPSDDTQGLDYDFYIYNIPNSWPKFTSAQVGVLEAYGICCDNLSPTDYTGFYLNGLYQAGARLEQLLITLPALRLLTVFRTRLTLLHIARLLPQ
jgi:hypothetical protein